MKPGDLVRFREERLDDEPDSDFYRGKIGVILFLGNTELNEPGETRMNLYDVLLDGQVVGGFEYEMELIE